MNKYKRALQQLKRETDLATEVLLDLTWERVNPNRGLVLIDDQIIPISNQAIWLLSVLNWSNSDRVFDAVFEVGSLSVDRQEVRPSARHGMLSSATNRWHNPKSYRVWPVIALYRAFLGPHSRSKPLDTLRIFRAKCLKAMFVLGILDPFEPVNMLFDELIDRGFHCGITPVLMVELIYAALFPDDEPIEIEKLRLVMPEIYETQDRVHLQVEQRA